MKNKIMIIGDIYLGLENILTNNYEISRTEYFNFDKNSSSSFIPDLLLIKEEIYNKNKKNMSKLFDFYSNIIILIVIAEDKIIKFNDSLKKYFIDYINDNDILIKNKIEFLIKMKNKMDYYNNEIGFYLNNVINIINNSTFLVLVLDENMKIQFCNNYLSECLGYNDQKDIINKNWIEFIPEKNRNIVKNMFNDVKSGNTTYRETVNEIECINGNIKLIKWFNSKINHVFNGTVSLGIQIESLDEQSQSVETIRNVYKSLIEKDRHFIESIKDIISENKKEEISNCFIN